MFPTLIIDTATDPSSIVLMIDDKKYHQLSFSGQKASSHLYPQLIDLLKESQTDIKEIKSIIVGVGPGSFTGIRIGLSAANGIAYSLKIPIYGVCSLFAYFPKEKNSSFISIFDARSGGVFVSKGQTSNYSPQFDKPERLSLLDFQKKFPSSKIITPHGEFLKEKLSLSTNPEYYPSYIHWPSLIIQSPEDSPPTPIYLAEPINGSIKPI